MGLATTRTPCLQSTRCPGRVSWDTISVLRVHRMVATALRLFPAPRRQTYLPCRASMTTVEGSAWVSRWLVENYTTTSSTNSTSSIAGEGNNGLGTPAIIGIIAACVVVAVLSVLGFLLVRRRNSRPNQGQAGLWDDDIITANRIPREKSTSTSSSVAAPLVKSTRGSSIATKWLSR